MVLPLTNFHVLLGNQEFTLCMQCHFSSHKHSFVCMYVHGYKPETSCHKSPSYLPYVACRHEWSLKQLTTGCSASSSHSTALLHCAWGAGSSPLLPSPDVNQWCVGSKCCRHFRSSHHWQRPGGLCHFSQPTRCLPPPSWPAEAATPCPFTAAEVDPPSCLHLAPAGCRPVWCTASRTCCCHDYPSDNHYDC